MNRPLKERFWAKVNKTKGQGPQGRCWLWTGSTNEKGYGRHGNAKAHRVAYELEVGPIPDGLILLHSCDTPACVRPSHLKPGTHLENKRDAIAKKRHAYGDKHGRSFLTEDQVKAIRKCHHYGVPQNVIAAATGLTPRHVCKLVNAENWRHLATEGGVS